MGNPVYHAHHIDISTAQDTLATWTAEALSFLKTYPGIVWYGLKHETGETDSHLHMHLAVVFELCSSSTTGGAKRCENLKTTFIHHCKSLASYLLANPSRRAIVVAPMRSDEFIAIYMQKKSSLKYSHLPADLAELRPYFPDLQAKKVMNPDFDKWTKMYLEDEMPMPATPAHVWHFMLAHMHQSNDIRIVADKKRLMERCTSLSRHINQDWDGEEDNPFLKKQKTALPPLPRVCPRCDKNYLDYRQQICFDCKNPPY